MSNLDFFSDQTGQIMRNTSTMAEINAVAEAQSESIANNHHLMTILCNGFNHTFGLNDPATEIQPLQREKRPNRNIKVQKQSCGRHKLFRYTNFKINCFLLGSALLESLATRRAPKNPVRRLQSCTWLASSLPVGRNPRRRARALELEAKYSCETSDLRLVLGLYHESRSARRIQQTCSSIPAE